MISRKGTPTSQTPFRRLPGGIMGGGLLAAFLLQGGAAPSLAAQPAATAERVNWAKYQPTFSDSETPGGSAAFVTDGIVDATSAWRSANGPGGHWIGVELPALRLVGTIQLFLGENDLGTIGDFTLNYDDGSGMQPLPGASFSGNTATVLEVQLDPPVAMSRFMLYTSDADATVREISLLPPKGAGTWPIGTDLTLDLARHRVVSASSTDGGNAAIRAVDGFAGADVAWRSQNVAGPHSLTVELDTERRIGSAHVYSGSSGSPAASDFRLQYWDETSGWLDVPGGVVAGNSQKELVVDFSAPVSTSRMLLLLENPGQQTIRELALFPAESGLASLPIGTSVTQSEPPTSKADDLGDRWWRLRNRHTAGLLSSATDGSAVMSEARPFTPPHEQQFQVLYNIGSDTYRIRHRATGQCLEAQDAATAPGTPVVRGDYHGGPHQLWRIVPTSDGYGQYLNLWSGLVLETDAQSPASLSLATPGTDWRQQWKLEFESNFSKKGIADYGWDWDSARAAWTYNWAVDPFGPLPFDVPFAPMQWGEANSDALAPRRGSWHREGKPFALLGFNEPDFGVDAGGSDMTVAAALDLWPQLEAMDLPLVAPAPAVMYGDWINDFHGQAAARGYRIDYTGVHWYGPPDAGGLIAFLQGIYNNYGRPIWLTEFSTTDFAGEFDWSEEDNYRFLAEFLWMAEDHDWFKRYAIFPGYSEQPDNPWDLTEPHCHIFDPDRNLTAVGDLYAGWDGDRTIRSSTPYLLHNKGTSLRIGNNAGALRIDTIRHHDQPMQWMLVPAATPGRVHLASLADGRRLRWTGSQLEFASTATSGSAVEWTYTHESNGYHFIDHPDSGHRLALHRTNDANGAPTGIWYSMESSATVDDSVRWRFIKPAEPGSLDGGLPPNWTSRDIGQPTIPGYALFDESLGLWLVGGSGADIFGPSDQFHFAASDFTGDGTIVARVAAHQNTDPHAKSGVMFRDGEAPDAPFAHLFVGPSGIGFEVRSGAGSDVAGAGYAAGTSPVWLKLERSGNSFTAWHSADGASWTLVGTPQAVSMPPNVRAGLSVTAHTNSAINSASFTDVSLLPTGWTSTAVGSPGIPGSSFYEGDGGTWTLLGSGADIWDASDQFQFASIDSLGDLELVARVDEMAPTHPWAKSGVMLRASSDPDAAFGAVFATPSNGVVFQYRTATGENVQGPSPLAVSTPCWVKLTRAGDTLIAFFSTDGTSWNRIGDPQVVALPSSSRAGLAVTSHDNALLNRSVFSNVSLDPLPPFDSWRLQHFTASQLGDPQISGELADANGDGVSNLIAYATGLGPWTLATAENGGRLDTNHADGRFEIHFNRNTKASDLTLSVEASDQLDGPWETLARSQFGAPFAKVHPDATADEQGGGDIRAVTVGDAFLMTDPDHPRRFLRLRIVR